MPKIRRGFIGNLLFGRARQHLNSLDADVIFECLPTRERLCVLEQEIKKFRRREVALVAHRNEKPIVSKGGTVRTCCFAEAVSVEDKKIIRPQLTPAHRVSGPVEQTKCRALLARPRD